MKFQTIILVAVYLFYFQTSNRAVGQGSSTAFQTAYWRGSGRWTGPEWWANPLFNWELREGTAIGLAAEDRTLCYLPGEITNIGTGFSLRVRVKLISNLGNRLNFFSYLGGFRIGRQGRLKDYRNSVVYGHKWIDAGVKSDGRIILGTQISSKRVDITGEVTLDLLGRRMGTVTQLRLTATKNGNSIVVTTVVPTNTVTGGISLLSDGPYINNRQQGQVFFAFRYFQFSGNMIKRYPERKFGPILWSQYTLNKGVLRLQAQFAPLNVALYASLWTAQQPGKWVRRGIAPIDQMTSTALFTIFNWNSKLNVQYQVRISWQEVQYTWPGSIRREPGANERLRIACFSCDDGYLFPLTPMVEQVRRQNPDMLFFAGDQIYETHGGFDVVREGPVPLAMLDFLRKYFLFGWTWRMLLRDRPSIILPDDHDVFQGNLFGHGGRKLPFRKEPQWDLGGYLMPGEWVAAVEKIQVGHLPYPAVNIRLPIGIKPYFTSLTYGGVGFAILEDRKFKTGPLSLSPTKRYSGEGADLLGPQQERFLQNWASNWQTDIMKCALSQTIFAAASTHRGYQLQKINYFEDSGGWPKAARNRVVRILGDNNVLSIHGDVHLGILLKQGVEKFDDAGYAFMVPGTANGWPRAWWPDAGGQPNPNNPQQYVGKFVDGAGHPLHVLAVANPARGSNLLQEDVTDPMELGYRKGSGYGMVDFDKVNKLATFRLYRLGDKSEMFAGFPRTVYIGGDPKKTAKA